MSAPVAWLLNFDADRELAAPGYTPSAAVRGRMASLAGELVGLVRDGDRIVDGSMAPRSLRGFVGRAWCPTPSALAALARVGADVPPAPPLQVLRSVNSRRFSAGLGQTLPGATFVDDLAALASAVARPLPSFALGAWCLKEAFGASGSGRRLVPPGRLDEPTVRWAARALRHGLQVEPWVERLGDYALHGHSTVEGTLSLGRPCLQLVTEAGSWQRSALASAEDLARHERLALEEELRRVAVALHAAGYFGPFNLDAFRYHGPQGPALDVRCEINARYTMGWAVGLDGARPDLP